MLGLCDGLSLFEIGSSSNEHVELNILKARAQVVFLAQAQRLGSIQLKAHMSLTKEAR